MNAAYASTVALCNPPAQRKAAARTTPARLRTCISIFCDVPGRLPGALLSCRTARSCGTRGHCASAVQRSADAASSSNPDALQRNESLQVCRCNCRHPEPPHGQWLHALQCHDSKYSARQQLPHPPHAALVQIVPIAASIMFSCAMLRVNFSAAAPTIAADLGLSVIHLAYIHSAFLAGYLLGHIPAGVLADRYGGAVVLCAGATAWAVATLLHASLALTPLHLAPVTLGVLRFLVGLTTAVAIPGLAATIAQLLPEERRSHVMSTCYGAHCTLLRGLAA
jgi:hypothetical protein